MKLRSGIKKSNANIAAGYLIFFLTIALTVSFALVVYESVRREFSDKSGIVSLAMLGAIIFISFICTIIDALRRSYMVKRPMKKILDGAEKIASGDFSVRLAPSHSYGRYDEFDLIMENLNMIASELGKNEILKTDFISNVSHELKTPIAVIKNTAEFLEYKLNDAEAKGYASAIALSAGKLGELVGNILALNKLENGGIAEELQEVKIAEVLEECIIPYAEKADDMGIQLEISMDYFTVKSSAQKLEIIFNNLISNALKFTDAGGKISISLRREASDAVFKITDTGIGISRDDGERIFEKFYQADTSHATNGTGLGLPLVKKVLSLLGGDINVESTLGVGTTFEIRLRSCVL